MAPYKRKTNKTCTPKKAAAPPNLKRTLSEYILSDQEMGSMHCLSDDAKIFHGYTEMEFVVENSSDVVENEETRKQSARITRRLKAVRPGHPTIRRKAGPGKKLPGLHTEIVELKNPIPDVTPADPTTPILEKICLKDEGEKSDAVAEKVEPEVKKPRGPRMSMQTRSPATFQCRVCEEWFHTAYQKRVHLWDEHNISHVRFLEHGQVYSCGSKI